MAKQLDTARKDYAPLEKQADSLGEEVARIINNADHLAKMAFEGSDEVGRRVQQLKDKGQNGAKIDDFKSDPDIKNILAELDGHEKKSNEMRARWAKMLPEGQNLQKALRELGDRIHDDTDTRDKKKNRSFLPVDSKSLPDLIKLGKLVEEKLIYVRDEIVTELKQDFRIAEGLFTKQLARAVAETKQSRQSDDQKAMLGQALNIRLLTGRVNKARANFKEITACCQRAVKALADGDADAAKKAVTQAQDEFKEIAAWHKTYQDALKGLNTYARQAMEQSKDGKTILALIEKGIDQCYTDGGKLVKAVAAKVAV
jgi:hypothetical protein